MAQERIGDDHPAQQPLVPGDAFQAQLETTRLWVDVLPLLLLLLLFLAGIVAGILIARRRSL